MFSSIKNKVLLFLFVFFTLIQKISNKEKESRYHTELNLIRSINVGPK